MLEITPTSNVDKLSSLARNSESTSYGFSKSEAVDIILKSAGVLKFLSNFKLPSLAFEGEVSEGLLVLLRSIFSGYR